MLHNPPPLAACGAVGLSTPLPQDPARRPRRRDVGFSMQLSSSIYIRDDAPQSVLLATYDAMFCESRRGCALTKCFPCCCLRCCRIVNSSSARFGAPTAPARACATSFSMQLSSSITTFVMMLRKRCEHSLCSFCKRLFLRFHFFYIYSLIAYLLEQDR